MPARFSSCENSSKIVGQPPYSIETVLDYARNQGSATRRECQKDPCCSQADDQDQRLDGRRVKHVPWGVAPRVTSLSASIGATKRHVRPARKGGIERWKAQKVTINGMWESIGEQSVMKFGCVAESMGKAGLFLRGILAPASERALPFLSVNRA